MKNSVVPIEGSEFKATPAAQLLAQGLRFFLDKGIRGLYYVLRVRKDISSLRARGASTLGRI
jgi:hypothetical protein